MGLTLTASSKSAEAPDIKPGMYDARFDGVSADTLEQSQFGDPNVFRWAFTLFKKGKVYAVEGEPVEVEALTSQSTNTKSKTTPRAVRYLKSLMTEDEFEAFVEGKPFDADALEGRMVQVQIVIKDSGWPKVEDVFPGRDDD